MDDKQITIQRVKMEIKRDLVKEIAKRAARGEEDSLDFLCYCVNAEQARRYLLDGGLPAGARR